MHLLHRKRGFTLIELLIVVAIIGILAAIVIPDFMNTRIRAKVSRVQSDIRAIAKAHEMDYLDNNTYPPESQDDIFTARGQILPRRVDFSANSDTIFLKLESKEGCKDEFWRVISRFVHPK
jgi:prepilin-type N-terminal cleavage/methylation domain-containing protein